MPDPNQNPEETLDWLLKKQKERKLTIQEQALLEQLYKLIGNYGSVEVKLIIGSEPDWGKISLPKYANLGLGYSGVITENGELGLKVTVNTDKFGTTDGRKIRELMNDLSREIFGQKGLIKPRRASHGSLEEDLLNELGLPNDTKVFAFALNLENGSKNIIEIGFFSRSVNFRKGVGQSPNDDRLGGVLREDYQEVVLNYLKSYFGSGYRLVRKGEKDGTGKGKYY